MSPAPPPVPGRIDPFTIGNFRVAIDGIPASSFSQVQGLTATIDVIDYRAGSDTPPGVERKLPGLNKFTNITLKRGLTRDLSLWNWINAAMAGNVARAGVVITLLDQADNPVLNWRLRNAWPCRWSGPVLDAGSSDVAIEELEIAHEGLEIAGT